MTDFNTWKSGVTTLGPKDLEKETTSPTYRNKTDPVESHLEEMWNKRQNGDQLRILWNTRPAHHLNLLHSIYLEKIKQLQALGFRTTILIFDKYHREIEKPSEPRREAEGAIRFAKKLARHGLEPEKTEILLETDFRQSTNTEELMDVMITLSRRTEYESEFDPDTHKITEITEGLIRHTIEIYYEAILQCDLILSGSDDLDYVWRELRSEIVEQNLFDRYDEPLILGIPTIEIDNEKICPTESIFFGENMDKHEIKQNLEKYEDLREKVFDYIVLPQNDGLVEVGGKKCASYEHILDIDHDKQISFLTEYLDQLMA